VWDSRSIVWSPAARADAPHPLPWTLCVRSRANCSRSGESSSRKSQHAQRAGATGMPELTVQDLAAKLRSERFDRAAPTGQALTDPIIDTPMSVTLDELRPYDLNPRIARNPKYDEIKA